MTEEHKIEAQPAQMSGQAGRIPFALKSQPAILHAVIQVTRKETGRVEEWTIVGTPETKE
jgi:hypothetical protein